MKKLLGLSRIKVDKVSLELLIKDLAVENPEYTKRKKLGKYIARDLPETIEYFYEDGGYYYIPREYLSESEKLLIKGKKVNFDFNIVKRDYQREFYAENGLNKITTGSFIWNVPTGHGKTVMALDIIQKFSRKTFIVCETLFLINQWVSRVMEFHRRGKSSTKDYIYIINTKTKLDTILESIEKANIVICTLKGFNTLDIKIKNLIAGETGTLIMDEGHHLGAKTFYSVLEEIPAQNRIMLTATLRRGDNMIKILKYSFGEVLRMDNKLPKAKLYFIATGIQFDYSLDKRKLKMLDTTDILLEEYKGIDTKDYIAYNKKVVRSEYLDLKDYSTISKTQLNQNKVIVNRFLSQCPQRRRQLIKLIKVCLQEKRKILVISPFLDLMYDLELLLGKFCRVFILDGKANTKLSPETMRETFEGVDVILGSTKVVNEGMDIDFLDTLIVFTPISDLEQPIGRITRFKEGKNSPMAFYFFDNNNYCYGMARKSVVHGDNYNVRGRFKFKEVLKMI